MVTTSIVLSVPKGTKGRIASVPYVLKLLGIENLLRCAAFRIFEASMVSGAPKMRDAAQRSGFSIPSSFRTHGISMTSRTSARCFHPQQGAPKPKRSGAETPRPRMSFKAYRMTELNSIGCAV